MNTGRRDLFDWRRVSALAVIVGMTPSVLSGILSTLRSNWLLYRSDLDRSKEIDGFIVRYNKDAGRLRDRLDPAAIVRHMAETGVYAYRAADKEGKVVMWVGPISSDFTEPLWKFVSDQQSWHGDWFIWSRIEVVRPSDGASLQMSVY
ncbi:hypothetical protein PLESTB_001214200 [Pleodorina starrii]|uniref:Uncharacterized protein n=1 Tax=Pleodorina starrii TaxID=330485 RepID=A0A9W6F5L5_9CHLO|nr:hypothetical protein PLESTM_001644900 [Pleodorina starrii]GLC57342.1 hypothetical protein PLESTB_001214200 [Pleodorina starrii]GLC71256.1 hypothetical protein PLESTF_001095500 [Pleodorina starrii]